MSTSRFFEARSIGDVTVIELIDAAEDRRVDLLSLISAGGAPPVETWEQLRCDLLRFLETEKPAMLVFDLGGLDHIGSQSIVSTAMNSVYVAAKRATETFGCQWRLCGFTAKIREWFEVLHFAELFPDVHDSQSEAVAAFSVVRKPDSGAS